MSISAQIFLVVGILWGLVATIVMIAAWRSIRSGNVASHKRFMLILLTGGWAFVAFYLIGYSLEQTYSKIVPERLVPWLAIHGVVALLVLFAITVLVWARLSVESSNGDNSRLTAFFNAHHKTIGRITAILWLLTQIGGFVNLYILR